MDGTFDFEKAETIYSWIKNYFSQIEENNIPKCYAYLLLAPYLAAQSKQKILPGTVLSVELFLLFISSILYVGKGTMDRCFFHEQVITSLNGKESRV